MAQNQKKVFQGTFQYLFLTLRKKHLKLTQGKKILKVPVCGEEILGQQFKNLQPFVSGRPFMTKLHKDQGKLRGRSHKSEGKSSLFT